MRRLATHIILAILAITALNGCTHNNGDIELWFGLWHLDSIDVDGMPDPQYDGRFYFMFQSKVFCIRWVDDQQHNYIESYAQWQESDDGRTLTINFVDNRYTPRVSLEVPDTHLSTVTTFNVITLTSTTMVLAHTASDSGVTYTYHLTLWQ